MTRDELTNAVDVNMATTHDALQLVVDELNKGQRQKIIKNENVKALLDRYGVNYGGEK